jgi:hypothetical protein
MNFRGVLLCFPILFFARFPKQPDGCDHHNMQLPTSHDLLLLTTDFDLALKVVQIKFSESTGAQVFAPSSKALQYSRFWCALANANKEFVCCNH